MGKDEAAKLSPKDSAMSEVFGKFPSPLQGQSSPCDSLRAGESAGLRQCAASTVGALPHPPAAGSIGRGGTRQDQSFWLCVIFTGTSWLRYAVVHHRVAYDGEGGRLGGRGEGNGGRGVQVRRNCGGWGPHLKQARLQHPLHCTSPLLLLFPWCRCRCLCPLFSEVLHALPEPQ